MVSLHKKFVILHLSDLQVGEEEKGRTKKEAMQERCEILINSLKKDLEHLAQSFNLKPNIIVISGDIAQKATGYEYNSARDLLNNLLDLTGIPSMHAYVVPGNHDISRFISKKIISKKKLSDTEKIKPEDHARLLSRFQNWSLKSKIISPTPVKAYRVVHIEEFNTIITLFDSTVQETHHKNRHFGYISNEVLNNAFEEIWDLDPDHSTMRIAVCHHNPRSEPLRSNSLRNGKEVETLLSDHGISLLLHGHIHSAEAFSTSRLGGHPVSICATGRATVSEDDHDNILWTPRYEMISLDTTKSRDSFVIMRKLELYNNNYTWVGDQIAANSITGIVRFKAYTQSNQDNSDYLPPINFALHDITNVGPHGNIVLSETGLVNQIIRFKKIDFDHLFRTAEKKIDIANIYGGSWLGTNLGSIRSILESRDVTIRFCMIDPDSKAGEAAAYRQSTSIKKFKETVFKSIDNIKKLSKSCDKFEGKIQVFLSPRPIFYTIYRFDSLLFFALHQISSNYPTANIPVLILRDEGKQDGFSKFINNDISRLFEKKDSKLYLEIVPSPKN